jgi:hypothetical protein
MDIALDKIKHLKAGGLCALLGGLLGLMLQVTNPALQPWLFALAALLAAATGKELLWDWMLGRGTPSVADALFTLPVGLLVVLVFYVAAPAR